MTDEPSQIVWIPKERFESNDGRPVPREDRYVPHPQDAHIAEVKERQRKDDIQVAKMVLLPAIRAIEATGVEANETTIAKEANQYEPYVRRRMLALWRSKQDLIVNHGAGVWCTPEYAAPTPPEPKGIAPESHQHQRP